MADAAYIAGTYDFRRIGIQAAADRYNRASSPAGGAHVGAAPAIAPGLADDRAHVGAPWFSSYSRRKAYVLEVNQRMDQLWRDIYSQHFGAATPQGQQDVERLRTEFGVVMKQWQEFVAGLSIGGMMLPSTEEYAQRIDQQIEHWSKRLVELGGKTTHAPYVPQGAPPGPPFPWGKLFVAVAVVGVAAGIIFVGSKLPDVPGRRYA